LAYNIFENKSTLSAWSIQAGLFILPDLSNKAYKYLIQPYSLFTTLFHVLLNKAQKGKIRLCFVGAFWLLRLLRRNKVF
jgi:hypothetical protein